MIYVHLKRWGIQQTSEKAQVVYKLTSTAIAQQGISLAAKGSFADAKAKAKLPLIERFAESLT